MAAVEPYSHNWQQIVKVITENPQLWMITNPFNIDPLEVIEDGTDVVDNFSCFNIPPYIYELFQFDKYDKPTENPTTFLPGHIYFFDVYSHQFTILYFPNGEIWYVDYYIETERPNPLRFERLSLDQFDRMIENMYSNDVASIAEFHHGSEQFENDLDKYMVKYVESVKGYKMEFMPDLMSLLRVAIFPKNTYGIVQLGDDAHRFDQNNPRSGPVYLRYLILLAEWTQVVLSYQN